ncbi:MAG: hypothetical protein WEG40_21480 [Candidatus Rokuibacteriota bacterium]
MGHQLARLAVAVVVTFPVFIGWGEAQSPKPAPAPKSEGPVQGYHGGYDPIDKSKAPAAPGGKKTDTGNADEGRRGKTVSGAITAIDGRKLTLDSGLILVLPPTLSVDQNTLTVGARIKARYENQGGSHVVTTISRTPS